MGVGEKGGYEAEIYAARRFMSARSENQVSVKLDFKNVFKFSHCDALLDCVASRLPEFHQFCHTAHGNFTSLQFGSDLVQSAEGVQQGDPLGPIFYCSVWSSIQSSLP